MVLNFHRQQKDYWCGPACAQMFLGGTQALLAAKLKTNARIGTTRRALVRLLRTSGKAVTVYSRGTLRELACHIPALVSYQEVGGVDHYTIVLRVTKKQVIMHDPWHGSSYALSRDAFLKRWKNPKLRKKYTGWHVSVC